jgi:hypothetical protein
MKNFSAIFCLHLAVLFISITFAQPQVQEPPSSEYISNRTINLMDNPNDYTGSPYYNEDFSKAIILKQGKVVAYNQEVRYNVSKELFEIKDADNEDSNIINTIIRNGDIEIRIGDVDFEYISSQKNNLRGYFIPLFKGDKFSLYKKIIKEYIPSQKAINSMSTDIAALYREKEILYLVDSKDVFTSLPSSKGGKIKVFKNLKKEVKTYIKENRLNINRENDLLKLVSYIDSL